MNSIKTKIILFPKNSKYKLLTNSGINNSTQQQQQTFQQSRNGFNDHNTNPGIAPSQSSIALINRNSTNNNNNNNNSNDSNNEKPNFIALFDYEQVS